MNNVFEQLGYSVTKIKFSRLSEEKQFFYIPNNDGSIRCIWPANISQPLFLEFDKLNTLFSKPYATFIKLVFLLGLQSYVFEKTSMYVVKNNKTANGFDINGNWALFNDLKGENNKTLIFTQNEDQLRFIKVRAN